MYKKKLTNGRHKDCDLTWLYGPQPSRDGYRIREGSCRGSPSRHQTSPTPTLWKLLKSMPYASEAERSCGDHQLLQCQTYTGQILHNTWASMPRNFDNLLDFLTTLKGLMKPRVYKRVRFAQHVDQRLIAPGTSSYERRSTTAGWTWDSWADGHDSKLKSDIGAIAGASVS
ncbi:uncharacterized protein PG998_014678 [Apiospora kogelbergensis]|uniref:uncharacterized protein n=1 Tax=Apiospora kogelbergensis TaxID=1337665 RepID=UPI00312D54C5